MSTYTEEKQFTHNDDCKMSGCPGHTLKYQYSTTSDGFLLSVDGEAVFGGDINLLKTFLDVINYDYLNISEENHG